MAIRLPCQRRRSGAAVSRRLQRLVRPSVCAHQMREPGSHHHGSAIRSGDLVALSPQRGCEAFLALYSFCLDGLLVRLSGLGKKSIGSAKQTDEIGDVDGNALDILPPNRRQRDDCRNLT